jgi:hypothetical protein
MSGEQLNSGAIVAEGAIRAFGGDAGIVAVQPAADLEGHRRRAAPEH